MEKSHSAIAIPFGSDSNLIFYLFGTGIKCKLCMRSFVFVSGWSFLLSVLQQW